MRKAILSASALALAATGALAQDVILLDEITVTANRTETETRSTGSSVAVLTAEDIAASGAVELADVLARLPGVTVTQQGPVGSLANLRVRGADGRYLAVFVDGIRMDDPSGTQVLTDFGGILVGGIGRVELVRGSQSALYGASAVGGVIDITTAAAPDRGLSQTLNLTAGSYATAGVDYALTNRGDAGYVALTFSHLQSDGFSAWDENDGGVEPDGFEGTRLGFSGEHRLSDVATLSFAGFVQDRKVGIDFPPFDMTTVQSSRETGARVSLELSAATTDHRFDLTRYDIERSAFSNFSGARTGLSWTAETEVSPTLRLVYGLDAVEETSTASYGTNTSRTVAAFGQVLWEPLQGLNLSTSLRSDDESSFGRFTSGRLALAWALSDATTLRAVAASGFRAPSLDERFGEDVMIPFLGNPALTPEESTSFELGVEQLAASGMRIQATLFRLETDNRIRSCVRDSTDPLYNWGVDCVVPVPAGYESTTENVPGTSVRQGIELGVDLPVSDRIGGRLAYTYTDARNPDGRRQSNIPYHALSLDITAEVSDRVSASLGLVAMDGGLNMDDFATVSVGAEYALTDTMSVSARIENLFDTEYQTVRGYGTSDRAFYVGLRSRF